jgi:hypothetical protein
MGSKSWGLISFGVGYIVPSIFIWITMFPVGEDKN